MRVDLRKLADQTGEALRSMPFVPDIEDRPRQGISAPYDNLADQDRWWAMFFAMFGTRQQAVVDMFLRQIVALVPDTWDAERNVWVADVGKTRAMLGLIQSMKPKTVAEAALAAQLVALHLNNMKLAEGLSSYRSGDARTAATMARVTRAYADGLLTLQKLQGKARKSKQTIRVETHHHHHQHIHYETGGGPENGGRADATSGTEGGKIIECAALPGPDQGGALVPLAGRKGQARLPDARRRQRKRGQKRDG
jgi:hypothetical protein